MRSRRTFERKKEQKQQTRWNETFTFGSFYLNVLDRGFNKEIKCEEDSLFTLSLLFEKGRGGVEKGGLYNPTFLPSSALPNEVKGEREGSKECA